MCKPLEYTGTLMINIDSINKETDRIKLINMAYENFGDLHAGLVTPSEGVKNITALTRKLGYALTEENLEKDIELHYKEVQMDKEDLILAP